MTVTELREKLQHLEAQGHGALEVCYMNFFKDRDDLDEPFDPEVRTEDGMTYVRI